MMFDYSGSMKGNNWNSLLAAFKNFLSYLTKNQELTNNSWLTVILYNTAAVTKFERQKPSSNLSNLINVIPDGGTDFSAPLL